MKTYSLIVRLCAVLFLVLQAACATTSSENVPARDKASPAQETEQGTNKGPISKEKAITIAKDAAAKTYQTLESFKVCACERARLWVVIYDGGGPEYYVDKTSGAIVFVQKLPQSLNANSTTGATNGSRVISEAQAIEIAKKHFADFLVSQGDVSEHVHDYDAIACELTKAWRVFFDYRAAPGQDLATLPNSNPPNYVIDKKFGKIIFTTHQIAK